MDRTKGLFYPEQVADMSLPRNVLFYVKRKCRRCGWSHSLIHESVAECHLEANISVYFVSMNLQDAYKKIEECKRFYHEVHPQAQRPIIAQNRTMIRFGHGKGNYSDIIATFRARGMPGRDIKIKIDEADHIADLREAIQDAAPNIIQGNSYLKLGGTVNRDHGPFFDFFDMDFGKIFPDPAISKILKKAFRRSELYWWQVPWLLNPVARKNRLMVGQTAPALDTRARVSEFGSDRLKLTFAMLPLEDFQQEFELRIIQSGSSLISWELILAASSDPKHEFLPTTEAVAKWAHEHDAKLFGGYDVGRTKNDSELTIYAYFERFDMVRELYAETHSQVKLPKQTARLKHLMRDELPSLKLAIDQNGLGREMAETLEDEFPGRAIPTDLEHYQRSGIIDAFASRFIHGKIQIVPDKDRRQQIHSIKRKTSESGKTIYYVHRKEKHHADKAISQALAIHAIGANSMYADFNIDAGGSMVGTSHRDLDELCGGHDEFLRDVVNV